MVGRKVRKINAASPAWGLFVEPEGEPAGDGFFIAGLFGVSVPDVESDGDGFAGLELDVAFIFFEDAF